MPIEHEKTGSAEAEKAAAKLKQGIARSRMLLRQYRARLSILRGSSPPIVGDRPLFRFDQ